VDALVLAIPVFLVLAALEAALVSRRAASRYRLGDLVSGLGCGTLDQVVNAFVSVGFLALYVWVRGRWALVPIELTSAAGWVACVIAHDLGYYLFHRASHRVNVLWAAHAVHHQSEDYTLAVSLRQGTIATWVSYGFYLPLAVVGFPVEMFIAVHGVYQVYQFFVHTRLIPSLGPLEAILASPLLHRVHHGRDADFLDKNYGGFFIVWDKLLGTFTPYSREPDYGVTAGIQSWSPYWANLHPYADLARRAARAPTLRAAAALWIKPPEWTAPWDAHESAEHGYGPAVSHATAVYTLVQLAIALAAGFTLLWPGFVADRRLGVLLAAFVLLSLVSLPALWDRRPWAWRFEVARLALVVIGAGVLALGGALSGLLATVVLAGCVASIAAVAAVAGPRAGLAGGALVR
jgi:sterol desaturase/sphingolipid hydroxylase (fatty acid hydroxylase superfamily)